MAKQNYLTEIKMQQLNNCCDERFSANGGGYSQPHYTFTGLWDGKPVDVSVRDTSCGDFGDRYSVKVTQGENTWNYYYNSMGSEPIEEINMPKKLVDFLGEYLPVLYAVPMSRYVVDKDGCIVLWWRAAECMEDSICESLADNEVACASDQAFYDAYCKAHKAAFGWDFDVNC